MATDTSGFTRCDWGPGSSWQRAVRVCARVRESVRLSGLLGPHVCGPWPTHPFREARWTLPWEIWPKTQGPGFWSVLHKWVVRFPPEGKLIKLSGGGQRVSQEP